MQTKANILERIVVAFADLSPNGRTIAKYIQLNPYAVINMSMSDLAIATHTSKATMSRFFRQLGYESHQQARQALIDSRKDGFPLANNKSNEQTHIKNELQNIQQTYNDISNKQAMHLGKIIAKARRVFVIGFRNSYPMALHFRQQLMQIRTDVRILPQPGQSLGEDLVDISNDDIVIYVGFRRRPANFEQVVASLSKYQTILITDPSGQVFNQQVTHSLICHLGGDEAFDSYAAPMSIISLLCNKTYQALSLKGASRTASISALYSANQEISKL